MTRDKFEKALHSPMFLLDKDKEIIHNLLGSDVANMVGYQPEESKSLLRFI